MKITAAAVLAWLTLSSIVVAQDWVRLADKSRIRGEILRLDDQGVVIVDELGKRFVLKPDEFVDHKKGKPLDEKLAARIKDMEFSARGLIKVGRSALEDKRTAKDGRRILRRALALHPESKTPRALLGHFKAMGEWFESEKDAAKAAAKQYRAEKLTKYEGGWVARADIKKIKEAPDAWKIYDFRWRETAAYMKESGYIPFRDGWVAPDQKDLVEHALSIEKKTGVKLGGIQIGNTVCLHYAGAERAQLFGRAMSRARGFAARIHGLDAWMEKIDIYIVFGQKDDMTRFIKGCPEYQPGDAAEGLYSFLGTGGIALATNGLVNEAENAMAVLTEAAMCNNFVYGLVTRFTGEAWGEQLHRAPYLLEGAAALTEIFTTGHTAFVETDLPSDTPANTLELGATLGDVKAHVRKRLAARPITLMKLLTSSTPEDYDDYDQDLIAMSCAFVAFLTMDGRNRYGPYMQELSSSIDIVEKHFGDTLENVEKNFLAWLQ